MAVHLAEVRLPRWDGAGGTLERKSRRERLAMRPCGRERGPLFAGPARWLMLVALAALLAKLVLQAVAAAPAFVGLVNPRFVVIAFLHLVFLGVVAPALFAWGLRFGWLRDGVALRRGVASFCSEHWGRRSSLLGPPSGFLDQRGWPRVSFFLRVRWRPALSGWRDQCAAPRWRPKRTGHESGFDCCSYSY